MVLRNVVPRQGTEIVVVNKCLDSGNIIEKCSSPTGDGNKKYSICQGTSCTIEKCSSPTGDGNYSACKHIESCCFRLRNVVPRQGTEIILRAFNTAKANN